VSGPNGSRARTAAEPSPIAPGSLEQPVQRPFRAVDVLSGRIDAPPAAKSRARKQISAQLEPAQLLLLGELHARLNATATARIEKSNLVGLGIELLAAVLATKPVTVEGEFAPAPDTVGAGPADLETLAAFVRTHVRAYERGERPPDRGRSRSRA